MKFISFIFCFSPVEMWVGWHIFQPFKPLKIFSKLNHWYGFWCQSKQRRRKRKPQITEIRYSNDKKMEYKKEAVMAGPFYLLIDLVPWNWNYILYLNNPVDTKCDCNCTHTHPSAICANYTTFDVTCFDAYFFSEPR